VALDLAAAPRGALTRFAPAPTGHLHLGHVANAIYVWAVARATGGRVLLRIEDHDRQRSRPEYDRALLEDLAWLGFGADEGPVRQSDDDAAYRIALGRLQDEGLVYACTCSRVTMAGWSGSGCAGNCRALAVEDRPGIALRVALGNGDEAWTDLLAGRCMAPVAPAGDPPIRDRHGNWTYAFAVVVDDLRQGVEIVVRGADLLEATAPQVRLARALGRDEPPRFLHHPLIRRPDGAKLSKAERDTSIRELRADGARAEQLIGRAAAAVGLLDRPRHVAAAEVADLLSPS
jgi:glutamyl/glutaminyl-tRNA synthetase